MSSMRFAARLMVATLVALLLLAVPTATVSADVFPLLPDFSGTLTPADWVLGGDAYLTAAQGVDPAGDGWLRLTEARGNRKGYAYYDVAFPSDRGLVVTFDFCAWGGSGADGLTFFLFDGDTATFSPGGYGGSLGYAQRYGIDGLSNGYLGVGLDEFGNFSRGNEGRNGGPGFRRDAIAVRGPGHERTGYAYVAGTSSLSSGIDTARVSSRPDQGGDRFRRVEIRLEPGPSGYTVEVLLQSGAGASLEQVIAPTAIGENPPETLKMGFTASTGGATNNHEIRNLSVSSALSPTELSGTVTEIADGQPISGATITVVDADGHTLNTVADGSGQWTLSSADTDLVSGPATVTADAPGFCAATGNITLAEGVPNTLNQSLAPASISGVVTDAATGVPLAGATVVLEDAVGTSFTTTTTVGGGWSLANALTAPLATGEVTVTATQPRYALNQQAYTMSDCGPNVVDHALDTSDIWFYKSDGRLTASPGERLTYTLIMENHGSMAAAGVVVVDELLCHEYVTVLDMTPGAAQVGHVYTWTLPSAIEAGASETVTMVVQINDTLPDGETVLANYGHATVTGSPEADATSNEQSDVTSVTAHPNLTIAKTATSDSVPVGVNQLITYTLTGDNRGNANATGVVITDTLDGLVTYVPGSAELTVGGSPAPLTVTQTALDLVFALPEMPPNASGELTYAVMTPGSLPPGTLAITNTATVTLDQADTDLANNTDGYQMPAQAFLDLSVTKLALPEFYPARPGGLVVNTLNWANQGTTTGNNAFLGDALPALVDYVPGSLYVNGAPHADPPIGGGMMALHAVDGALGVARAQGVISYTVRITDTIPAGVTAITNTAIIYDGLLTDGFPGDNMADAVTPIEATPDLQVTLDDGLEYVQVDDTLTWSLAFRNVGNQGASNVVITCTLAEGVTYVPSSASDAGAYDAGAHAVRWDLPNLDSGDGMTYTLQGTVDETHSAGSLAFAEVTIVDDGANGAEPTPGDNYASDTDRVIRPCVVVDKSMSGDMVVGETVVFSLAYQNYAKAPGLNVTMTDTLPASLEFVDASGNWSRDGQQIVWDLGTVSPQSGGTVMVTATLTSLPDALGVVSPTMARPFVPMNEAITSTLTHVPSRWYVGSALTPTLRVLWQDKQSVGPRGWTENPRLPGVPDYTSWPDVVAAGIEVYWLDEADLGAQWVAHDPAGQAEPNYGYYRHVFYLPLNITQAQVRMDVSADDLGEAWINGTYVGSDYGAGGATALTDVKGIQAGANVLAVRLLNNDHGGHAIYVDPQRRFMCHPGLLYRLDIDYCLRPFVYAPSVVRAGEPITLSLQEAVLAGEPPYALSIDYGDGLSGSSSMSHVYDAPGTYTVTVEATDALGQIGLDTFPVQVQPAYSRLVVNGAQLSAQSQTHTYLSEGGTANASFIGLEQVLGVHKEVFTQTEQADGSHDITYAISISSTRTQINGLPLYDTYDPELMTFVSADPQPNSVPYPGLLVWDDLTGAAPNGVDRALAPDAPIDVFVMFSVAADVSGRITNTASVDGAQDSAGLDVNDDQADAVLDLARPSVALAPPMAWGGVDGVCAGWNQRWTLSATNDGNRALSNATLTAIISDTLPVDVYDVVWEDCSPDAMDAGDGRVAWNVGALEPGETVERDLVLRPYCSVPVGTVVEVCSRLDSDQLASELACAESEIVRCDEPTPTVTAEPTATVEPSPTPGNIWPLYLPIIFK